MAHGLGFFISPRGRIIDVPQRHITTIIEQPERFGWTRPRIEELYRRHGEPLGIEAKAREEIILAALDLGWIRIREYFGRESYWAFQFGQWSPQVAQYARRWAKAMLAREGADAVTDPHAEVRLRGSDGKAINVTLSELVKLK